LQEQSGLQTVWRTFKYTDRHAAKCKAENFHETRAHACVIP